MTIYATYFDNNFLVRGIACLESLIAESASQPRILILTLDKTCEATLRRLGQIGGVSLEIIALSELERLYPGLLAAKAGRTLIEYYYTLSPFLCGEALKRTQAGEYAIYLDADMFFYSDPGEAIDQATDAEVAIVEHRFPANIAFLERFGRFNVGWIMFRRGEIASRCVARWQTQCLDWCFSIVEETRFGDQKYLDAWPREIKSLVIIDHPGVNLAPWNVARHRLSMDGTTIMVDNRRLIFFHFHKLRQLRRSIYEVDMLGYGETFEGTLGSQVYARYLRALEPIEHRLHLEFDWAPTAPITHQRTSRESIRAWLAGVERLFQGTRLIFRNGKVLRPWRALRYL